MPGLFQLSTGEVSLLNLFLTILRDHDLSGAEFTGPEEICGVVVVDEIDLHLHATHQYEVLPKLMAMFPKVQFVVTSHSPLFVLGLERALGEDGFQLYRLPEGESISPEDFGEFDDAYGSFTATQRHAREIQEAVGRAQKPLVYVEGDTDKRYLEAAIEKLGLDDIGSKIEIRDVGDGGGEKNLNIAWKGLKKLAGIRQPVALLFDCDVNVSAENWPESEARVFRRKIERIDAHPIQKGIENLFGRETLDRAREAKRAFIDVVGEHKETMRGEDKSIPETWTVNRDEKTNLCDWLCENGTLSDFDCFRPTLEMLEDIFIGQPAVETS